MNGGRRLSWFIMAGVAGYCLLAAPQRVSAHCDTLDGPVVGDARVALAKGDVTPVLKWVKPESEKEVRAAFDRTLAVRGKSPEARDLADMYFFETIVRLHRAGEGAPYTGLKPGGSTEPAIVAADKALESGSVDAFGAGIGSEVAAGLKARFSAAYEAQKHASESVDAGRTYVAAYVNYIHFVEALHEIVAGATIHEGRE